MQSNFLANKILKGIDRVNKNFLWESSDHTRKMHWVNWNEVTKPKESGGLQSAKGSTSDSTLKRNHNKPKSSDSSTTPGSGLILEMSQNSQVLLRGKG